MLFRIGEKEHKLIELTSYWLHMWNRLENTILKIQLTWIFALPVTVKQISYRNQRKKTPAQVQNRCFGEMFLSTQSSQFCGEKLGNFQYLLTDKRLKNMYTCTAFKFCLLKNYSLPVTFRPICEAAKLTEVNCPFLHKPFRSHMLIHTISVFSPLFHSWEMWTSLKYVGNVLFF